MCIPCSCPQTLPAPTPQFERLRLCLKIIALVMLIFAVFNFIVGSFIGGIYTLLLIYFLYVGWAQFNSCAVLFFFVFSLYQAVQFLFGIISMTEHHKWFPGGMDTFASIVVIICFAAYTTFIFVSHYIYRHFKNAQQGASGFGNLVPGGANYAAQEDQQEAPPMRPAGAGAAMPPPRAQPQAPRQPASTFTAFTGQGVRLG